MVRYDSRGGDLYVRRNTSTGECVDFLQYGTAPFGYGTCVGLVRFGLVRYGTVRGADMCSCVSTVSVRNIAERYGTVPYGTVTVCCKRSAAVRYGWYITVW